jgi:hypothetical protein
MTRERTAPSMVISGLSCALTPHAAINTNNAHSDTTLTNLLTDILFMQIEYTEVDQNAILVSYDSQFGLVFYLFPP